MKAIKDAIGAFRSGEGLKGQLLRGGVGSVAVKIGSTLLNVLLAVVLARTLGAEGFGVYSFVFALITILAIPAQMGLPNLVVRETAKAQATGDWALMKGLWRWSSLMALSMSAALMALGGVAAWIFAANLPEGGLAVFYWGLVLVPLVALGNLRGAALRGLRHVVQGQLPEFILRPAFLIMLVLSAHFGLSARALTASDAMMLHAVASLVAFGIGAWLLLRARPDELQPEAVSSTQPSSWLKSALSLGVVTGLQVLNQGVGSIFLGLQSDTADVGYLRLAIQGSLLIGLGANVAFSVAGPHIARLSQKHEYINIEKIASYAAQFCLLLACGALVLYILAGNKIIVLVFGPDYIAVYLPLLILCIGQVVNSATALSGTVLVMLGAERYAAYSGLIAVITNGIICILAVPFFGAVGGAIALSLATTVEKAFHCYVAYNKYGINTFAIRLPRRT